MRKIIDTTKIAVQGTPMVPEQLKISIPDRQIIWLRIHLIPVIFQRLPGFIPFIQATAGIFQALKRSWATAVSIMTGIPMIVPTTIYPSPAEHIL